jgi:Protein of unknown function (DUF2855)
MDFVVKRDNLRECGAVESAAVKLEPGQVLLRISAFGLTSNNITYGVLGEGMSYWSFFPSEDGWGRIPVWGFADVSATEHDAIEEGTRVFGYLPPSEYLVVAPDRVDARGFRDASGRRSSLPSAYNRYVRVDADPLYDIHHEDQQMLLQPLFFTAYLISDFLDENGLFGARAIVLSSASSKTALSTAFLLTGREGVDLVGLTSPKNLGFVEALGVYDRVIPYEAVSSLPAAQTVYVDMAGDADVRSAVHHHLGDALVHSSAVGATHWDQMTGAAGGLPGPRPTLFFAPERVSKRTRDWGVDGLNTRIADAWRPYLEWTSGWLKVVHGHGAKDVERAYLELLEGRSDPSMGHVLSMSP